jgi:hypothetical protein
MHCFPQFSFEDIGKLTVFQYNFLVAWALEERGRKFGK